MLPLLYGLCLHATRHNPSVATGCYQNLHRLYSIVCHHAVHVTWLVYRLWTVLPIARSCERLQVSSKVLSLHLQPYTLNILEEKMTAMYRAVTDGKFGEALRQVNMILAIIPLTVVNTRHEVDELKEVISIARCAPHLMIAHAFTSTPAACAGLPREGHSACCLHAVFL